MPHTRRRFLQRAARATSGLAALAVARRTTAAEALPLDSREYLSGILYTRKEVDDWFAGRAFRFEKYDGQLGWILRDIRLKDGIDGSTSTYRYGRLGERRMINYAHNPCRINTYGNSFTQCHQVSDGETWQEVLAAHLGEPVRNFGVGGYSVYQAYRRMLREEAKVPARTIVFNIYSDDHFRNLPGWRLARKGQKAAGNYMQPTLPHLRVNLSTGECQERENPCPTADSFYRLSDLDWVDRQFRDDFVVGIRVAQVNGQRGHTELAWRTLEELGRLYGFDLPGDRRGDPGAAAQEIFTRAALTATKNVIQWVDDFARKNDRKVLFVLSFPSRPIAQHLEGEPRFDQPVVDFLDESGLPYVDLAAAHAADFAQFNIGVQDYLKRYYIGHYSPKGNAFTAFAIKDALVELLDPKPPAYLPPS